MLHAYKIKFKRNFSKKYCVYTQNTSFLHKFLTELTVFTSKKYCAETVRKKAKCKNLCV